jgi:beclin 1
MSFVMLTESQVGPPGGGGGAGVNGESPSSGKGRRGSTQNGERGSEDGSFYDQAERTKRAFDIVSAQSDIDEPVCVECTELLVEGLQKQLTGNTKERDAYVSFLRSLNTSIPTADDVVAAEKAAEETEKEEEAAYAQVVRLEEETARLDEEMAVLEEEAHELDLDEEGFWRERNAFGLTLAEFQNERDALNMRYDHDSRQLEQLQRTNIYNDTFCIGHDGYFGTINGLRLGRLNNPPVEWPEINAAWGQATLLLNTIAEKLGFQFLGYRLRAMGSTSRVEKIEYPQQSPTQSSLGSGNQAAPPDPKITKLDLFSSGDLPLHLPWLHRRFDAGMVAFLECLRQLGEFVEGTTRRGQGGEVAGPGLKLPYEIKRDRIGDASIKLGFNQNDETWTRACKYTLTCCKFLLAHASNVVSAGANNSAAVAAAAVAAEEQARHASGTPAKKK